MYLDMHVWTLKVYFLFHWEKYAVKLLFGPIPIYVLVMCKQKTELVLAFIWQCFLVAIAPYSPNYNPQINTDGEVFMDSWIETQIAPARCW